MTNKVRVYGKAQNRTALGIVNAYLVMHPHATFEDLKKAFPDALNPDSGVKFNFIESGQSTGSGNWDGYFSNEDELLTTGDGKKVALVKMWTKPSFKRLLNHASQYGIETVKVDTIENEFGKKIGYRLEYLNGYIPPVPEQPKSYIPPVPEQPKSYVPPVPEQPKKKSNKKRGCLWKIVLFPILLILKILGFKKIKLLTF